MIGSPCRTCAPAPTKSARDEWVSIKTALAQGAADSQEHRALLRAIAKAADDRERVIRNVCRLYSVKNLEACQRTRARRSMEKGSRSGSRPASQKLGMKLARPRHRAEKSNLEKWATPGDLRGSVCHISLPPGN
jgi:hypothetical protein